MNCVNSTRMMKLLIFLMVYSVPCSSQIDWCSRKCNGKEHTMCKYRMETNKNACRDQKNAMTDTVKEKILGLHNYVRNHMAAGNVPGWPGASDMRQMTWDETCASVALMWTFQCVIGHDDCRKTDKFESVGQNWGYTQDSEAYPDGAFRVFKSWLDEIGYANAKTVDKYKFKSSYGHYTALVWANTYKIGCGLVNCTTNEAGRVTYRATLTCNYAPAGNVVSHPMWIKGDPCKKCPIGTACNPKSTYPNLCAASGDPIDEVPVPIDINATGPRKFTSYIVLTFSSIIITTVVNLVKRY